MHYIGDGVADYDVVPSRWRRRAHAAAAATAAAAVVVADCTLRCEPEPAVWRRPRYGSMSVQPAALASRAAMAAPLREYVLGTAAGGGKGGGGPQQGRKAWACARVLHGQYINTLYYILLYIYAILYIYKGTHGVFFYATGRRDNQKIRSPGVKNSWFAFRATESWGMVPGGPVENIRKSKDKGKFFFRFTIVKIKHKHPLRLCDMNAGS